MEKEYPWIRIKPTEEPLSSDSYIIKGEKEYWIYDAGAGDLNFGAISKLDGTKNLIISHFHIDHIGNLNRLSFDNIYATKYTGKYIPENAGPVTIVDSKIDIADGNVMLSIVPMPSSHSKGSLSMVLNDEYIFMGDSAYGSGRDGHVAFNVSLLKEQTDLLKFLNPEYCVLSHEERNVYHKTSIIRNFERIYEKREKDNPYVFLEGQ